MLKYQSEYWKKCCTFRWAVQGEENTKYFQARATEKLRRNAITNLVLSDGRLIENHDEKATAFYDCFKKRMGVSSQPVYDFDLADLIQKCQGLEELSIPFTKEEIDNVIKIIPTDRAPGPHSFNGLFLKVCWDIIKEDFYTLCEDFWQGTINLQKKLYQ